MKHVVLVVDVNSNVNHGGRNSSNVIIIMSAAGVSDQRVQSTTRPVGVAINGYESSVVSE